MTSRRRPPSARLTVKRLRERLREAEETLKAIRDGHVDALIVNAPQGEEIYTLRSADQPYRLMVEQMREGALTLAPDATILYCNRRFAELVCCPSERVTGKNLTQFVEEEDAPVIEAILTSEAYRHEVQLRSSLGGSTSAQLSSTSLEIDGVRTLAVVVTDLTPERIERGLRESNRLKDEFLATLSHELRTPLNVILGWTRMLATDHMSARARQHALELIDRNAQAQAQLVNDLVDMSRLTTGKMRLELEPLPLVQALEAAVESVRPAAQGKGLHVETEWPTDDVNVLADRTRLQQVLWNLLTNAIKFTGRGGRIRLKATVDHEVRIEVIDSGIGIEPSFLPHVFDRFRQADSGTTRVYGGLGIGLAIVHDLVRLHGGDVHVESRGGGEGTTFTVTLPISTASPRFVERRGRLRETTSLSGHCIMLVEDHADSRDLLEQALKNSGASVAAFSAAQEAFEALGRIRPSVIVADIGLPDEDGYQFIRRVRSHTEPAIQTVPAIAVTAYATMPDRAEALAVGFQQHLAKPIDPGHLVQAIHDVTRREKD